MASWAPPPLPARVVASRRLPLVGRGTELEVFESAWAEVEQGYRQLVLIGGEPGIGKTRLVAEVAGALADHGVTVLVGAASADAAVPYQPFTDVLDHLFSASAEGSLTELVAGAGGAMRRLSVDVSRHHTGDGGLQPDTGQVRRDLFDAVSGFFRRLALQRPVALVLEDLHWAQLPTLALLQHLVGTVDEARLLVVATFRTTAPDRSEEITAGLAELHRLDGVQRLDLEGLSTDAIAEYVGMRSGLPSREVRASAALLRDRTGGNPFFLRELWADLERRGGIAALRSLQRVPQSISDSLQARIAGLGEPVRAVIETAAVLGDEFELATLVAASDAGPEALSFVDAASALGLIERVDRAGSRFSFVHSLTRQAVLDRMPPSRSALVHARAAQALEQAPPHPSIVPRLARHYLAAQVLGSQGKAVHYCTEAGRQAEASLAFEEAAGWFERAASLPDCATEVRNRLLLAAADDHVRACHFPQARSIFARLASAQDPSVRLSAAMGFEEATWRPGVLGGQAADLLVRALDAAGLDQRDPRYVRALGSLGRSLVLAGEVPRGREVGSRAVALATELGEPATLLHALTTSLWHGTTPDMAETQFQRSTELRSAAREARDHEAMGAAANFRAMVSYLLGRPEDLRQAIEDARRTAEATGQPYYRHIYACLAYTEAFMRGEFDAAERWAKTTLDQNAPFDDDIAEGLYGVQMFMLRRETGGLERFAGLVDGNEPFAGRWVPGLLALYTELSVQTGMRRALRHLLDRPLVGRSAEAQWPMELVFMTEAALALEDTAAVRTLRPLLAEYAGMNLASGTLIATFGSADRLLGRVAALLGDHATAGRHLDTALDMDRRMRSPVHVAESLAHLARHQADTGHVERSRELTQQALDLALGTGQHRIARTLAVLAPSPRPAGLSAREVDVLRLVAAGCSNQEIGSRLFISANTAANHVRSILLKTGAANRTQAAIYAAQHDLVADPDS